MHCLLCHEKIPRLRAWAGKSEFCCDEHAELYKKQTVERLLVGEGEKGEDAPALPISEQPADIVPPIEPSQPAAPPADAGDVDELWQFAEKMEPEKPALPLGAVSGPDKDDPFAALRALEQEAEASARDATAAAAEDDLSALEGDLSSLEALPLDLAGESTDAPAAPPELELEALASGPAEAAPELDLDALESASTASTEDLAPPELELAADESEAALAPPEPELAEEQPVAAKAKKKPASVKPVRKGPLKLRAVQKLAEVAPAGYLPEGGYPLKPWTDALEMAGPDRVSLFDPVVGLEMRQAGLNGTQPHPPAPEPFRASERSLGVSFPTPEPKVQEPEMPTLSALEPTDGMLSPEPLYAVLGAPEMKFRNVESGPSSPEVLMSLHAPAVPASFLSQVAFEGRVMEPQSSAILSPPEREVFVMASADEDAGGGSRGDESDGGERAHVADLF